MTVPLYHILVNSSLLPWILSTHEWEVRTLWRSQETRFSIIYTKQMAKTMLLMSSTVQAGYSIDLKRDSLIQLNSQRLWPKFSPHLFNPLPSTSFSFSSSSSSRTFTTLALFKSKTKAPPSKVINCFSNYFIILNNFCTLFIFFLI